LGLAGPGGRLRGVAWPAAAARREANAPTAASGSIAALMRRLFSRFASTRLLAGLATSVLGLLLLAPAAMAENDGRGFYGATDDKVVTEAGFILIIFFPTFVLLASLLQKFLEKRKDARVAAQRSRAGDARWRGGW
jgi:hypothetical protein